MWPSDFTLLFEKDLRTVLSGLTLLKRFSFSISLGLTNEIVLPESTKMSVGSSLQCPCTKILENSRNFGRTLDLFAPSSLKKPYSEFGHRDSRINLDYNHYPRSRIDCNSKNYFYYTSNAPPIGRLFGQYTHDPYCASAYGQMASNFYMWT